VRKASREKLKADIAAFITSASNGSATTSGTSTGR
jgi:hypothetical protein